MSPAQVAIVMMDSRAPALELRDEELTTQVQAKLLTAFTYYLNHKFACKHNYQLLFYKLADTDCAGERCVSGCAHPVWGDRHPSFCKLTAISAALRRGHDYVVYIDSDAFFKNITLSLPRLLHAYGAQHTFMKPERGTPHAIFGWDWPYTLGPNMGFIVLRNTEHGRRLVWVLPPSLVPHNSVTLHGAPCACHMLQASTRSRLTPFCSRLQAWWHVYSAQFGLLHPFEQHTLHWDVMHRARFRERIQTIRLRPMDPAFEDPVLHLDHNVGTKTRTWVMAKAITRILLEEGKRELAHILNDLNLPRTETTKQMRVRVLRNVLRATIPDYKSLQARCPMPVWLLFLYLQMVIIP